MEFALWGVGVLIFSVTVTFWVTMKHNHANPHSESQMLWQRFLAKSYADYLQSVVQDEAVFQLLSEGDFVARLRECTSREAYKMLRDHLPAASVSKLSDRFRSFKRREKSPMRSLEVGKHTYERLHVFREALFAETFDEMFDYLLSKRYDELVETTKTDIEREDVGSKEVYLTSLLARLTRRDQDAIELLMERVYRDAWRDAKASRSRKADAQSTAFTRYIEGLKAAKSSANLMLKQAGQNAVQAYDKTYQSTKDHKED
jgi:hypothetical protein